MTILKSIIELKIKTCTFFKSILLTIYFLNASQDKKEDKKNRIK